MKVGNTGNVSAKERRETVKRRRRYEAVKLARRNEKIGVKPVLYIDKFVKGKMGFNLVLLGS